MNRSTVLPLALILVAAVGGYAYFAPRDTADAAPTPPTPAGPAAPAPAAAGAPAVAVPLPPPANSADKAPGYIAYPDGTFYPPLNGVKVAPQIPFHVRLAPFTKVVGMETDATGRQWYVHEDGLRSTTYVNSKGASTYELMKPIAPQPSLSEEAPGGTGK